MITSAKSFYKININCRVWAFCLLFSGLQAPAQELEVVGHYKDYCATAATDSLQTMVELRSLMPSLVYDLRYATKNNFTGRRLYKERDVCFLRLTVAKALENVLLDLQEQQLGLKIFDAYRPYSVTKKMWELIGDERYVADPSKGSGHNRGLSVDLTLVHLATKTELDMGTGFDHFSDTAHHQFTQLPTTVLKNREILKSTMEKHGFKALATEWWHYSWPNNHAYDVLDIEPKKLLKTCKGL